MSDYFTIEQMIEIEPRLQDAIDFVVEQNKIAANEEMYYADVWPGIKSRVAPYVGIMCDREELSKPRYYDEWGLYLSKLATNML